MRQTRRRSDIVSPGLPVSRFPGLPVLPAVVVIGYGNDLCGDDAIGPRVAAAVAEWDLPGVRTLAVHQLTPELAEILATADLVIFVDACVSDERNEVQVRMIEPADTDTAIGHTGDPRSLLALAAAIYGCRPAAWLISVPALSFAFGAGLSPIAEHGIAIALQQVRDLIEPRKHEATKAQRR